MNLPPHRVIVELTLSMTVRTPRPLLRRGVCRFWEELAYRLTPEPRPLSPDDLDLIRQQLEHGFDDIEVIDQKSGASWSAFRRSCWQSFRRTIPGVRISFYTKPMVTTAAQDGHAWPNDPPHG